jgi:hypothetical protein
LAENPGVQEAGGFGATFLELALGEARGVHGIGSSCHTLTAKLQESVKCVRKGCGLVEHAISVRIPDLRGI